MFDFKTFSTSSFNNDVEDDNLKLFTILITQNKQRFQKCVN